jgi:hypothetical protein
VIPAGAVDAGPPADSASAAAASPAPPPAAAAPVDTAHLQLEGIVWSETDPVAMINGRILRVGGVVLGYTIVKIEPQSVELQGERGTIRLRVGSGS